MKKSHKTIRREPFDITKYADIVDAVNADISKKPHLGDFPEFSNNPIKNLSLHEYLYPGDFSKGLINAVSYMQTRYKNKLKEKNISSLETYQIARVILGQDK